jgi:hypothetical protein
MSTIKQTCALALASALLIFGSASAQDAKTANPAAYAGHYELAPGVDIVITYEANHLFAQVTGQDKYEVFPEAPDAIVWKIVEAKATFDHGPDGHITGLTMHQGGMDIPAKKVD